MIEFTNLIIKKFRSIAYLIFTYTYLHFFFKGGRGSTKSSFIALILVVLMIQDKTFNAVCIRKVADTLQDSVYNQIIWAIEKLGLTAYFRFKTSPLQIIYKPTGQRFYFRGCDRAEKIKSIKCKIGYLKAVWFEELTEFSGMKEIRTVTQSIIRGISNILCFYSFNPPEDGKNWVNEEVEKPRKNRYVSHSTYLDVPSEWLGADFLQEAEELKEHKPDDYNNEYLGLTSKTTLNIVKNFDLGKQIRSIILKALREHFGNDRVELHIRDFNPPIISRINAFNQRVKTNKGIYNIYIDPKCEKLIYNINNLKFKAGTSKIDLPTTKEIERDKDKKFLGHPFDAASYLVEFYWAVVETQAKR